MVVIRPTGSADVTPDSPTEQHVATTVSLPRIVDLCLACRRFSFFCFLQLFEDGSCRLSCKWHERVLPCGCVCGDGSRRFIESSQVDILKPWQQRLNPLLLDDRHNSHHPRQNGCQAFRFLSLGRLMPQNFMEDNEFRDTAGTLSAAGQQTRRTIQPTPVRRHRQPLQPTRRGGRP